MNLVLDDFRRSGRNGCPDALALGGVHRNSSGSLNTQGESRTERAAGLDINHIFLKDKFGNHSTEVDQV